MASGLESVQATTDMITATRRLFAHTDTIHIIRMLARLTATTGLIGSMEACLLAPGRGSMASAEVTGAVVTTDVAATVMVAAATGAPVMRDTPMLGEAGMRAVAQSGVDRLGAGSAEALAVDSLAVAAVASTVAADFTAVAGLTAAAAMAAGTGN